MEAKPIDIKGRRQLFFDDYCIEKTRGLIRQFNKPKKHPANPIFRPDEPWEKYIMVLYGNVIYDPWENIFQMWYSARSIPKGENDCIVTICHATSRDGIKWERTRVNLFEAGGMNLYNAVMEGRYVGPTVFYTPEAEKDKKYRAFLYEMPEMLDRHKNKTLFKGGAFSVYFSPDGIHWNDSEFNPAIQGGDIATCSYDPINKEYIAFTRTHRYDEGIIRRCVGECYSKDFLSWSTSSDIVLSADKIDDARVNERLKRFRDFLVYDDPSYYCADMQGMTGFRYENYYVGLIWFFDKSGAVPPEHGGNEDGIVNIQLAYKRCVGGRDFWHRADDRSDFISCGEPGDYDGALLFTAHTVVEVGDELWFYYSGISRPHGIGDYNLYYTKSKCNLKVEDRTGIGLATLRRDGFVSMDSSYPEGLLITKPFKLEGDFLQINAFAKNGYIRTEILDEQDNPVAGYGKDDCNTFSDDEIRHEVTWKNSQGLGELKGRVVKLAFHMQRAKLYSFNIQTKHSEV